MRTALIALALLIPAAAFAAGDDKPKLDCMLEKSASGRYSSFDGGKSAMAIMMACPREYSAYIANCEANKPSSDGACNVSLAIMIQVILKREGR